MIPGSRGVLISYWEAEDAERTRRVVHRCLSSLASSNPGLAIKVEKHALTSTFMERPEWIANSPFETTLALDADTVVMGDLSFGFDRAEKHSLACCICEAPWLRRYPSASGDSIEYNCGVIFAHKDDRTLSVLERWGELNGVIDSSITWGNPPRRMPYNDQAGFALALEQLDVNPFALPLNWNFRPIWHKTWFGPIKIWHDYSDPPRQVVEASSTAKAMDFFRLA